MPLTGTRLVIEPTYPKAAELAEIGMTGFPAEGVDKRKVRGRFWSAHKRSLVVIWDNESKPGKVEWGIVPGAHHLDLDIATLGCANAWGIEQEHNAVQLLGSLVRHRQLKQYLLTGMFLEKSERSGVHYLFRRLKPTVALRAVSESMRILATLCMHPIAYYEGSWAGAMAPTDDVVASLMLMRGDEPMFWRRSNQHPPHVPEAGL